MKKKYLLLIVILFSTISICAQKGIPTLNHLENLGTFNKHLSFKAVKNLDVRHVTVSEDPTYGKPYDVWNFKEQIFIFTAEDSFNMLDVQIQFGEVSERYGNSYFTTLNRTYFSTNAELTLPNGTVSEIFVSEGSASSFKGSFPKGKYTLKIKSSGFQMFDKKEKVVAIMMLRSINTSINIPTEIQNYDLGNINRETKLIGEQIINNSNPYMKLSFTLGQSMYCIVESELLYKNSSGYYSSLEKGTSWIYPTEIGPFVEPSIEDHCYEGISVVASDKLIGPGKFSATFHDYNVQTPNGDPLILRIAVQTSTKAIGNSLLYSNVKIPQLKNVPDDGGDGEDTNYTHLFKYTYDASGNRTERIIELINTTKTMAASAPAQFYTDKIQRWTVKIFPNPSGDRITAEFSSIEGLKNGKIKVFDFPNGTLILDQKVTSTIEDIDLSGKAMGIYILHFDLDGEISSWKVMKK